MYACAYNRQPAVQKKSIKNTVSTSSNAGTGKEKHPSVYEHTTCVKSIVFNYYSYNSPHIVTNTVNEAHVLSVFVMPMLCSRYKLHPLPTQPLRKGGTPPTSGIPAELTNSYQFSHE